MGHNPINARVTQMKGMRASPNTPQCWVSSALDGAIPQESKSTVYGTRAAIQLGQLALPSSIQVNTSGSLVARAAQWQHGKHDADHVRKTDSRPQQQTRARSRHSTGKSVVGAAVPLGRRSPITASNRPRWQLFRRLWLTRCSVRCCRARRPGILTLGQSCGPAARSQAPEARTPGVFSHIVRSLSRWPLSTTITTGKANRDTDYVTRVGFDGVDAAQAAAGWFKPLGIAGQRPRIRDRVSVRAPGPRSLVGSGCGDSDPTHAAKLPERAPAAAPTLTESG